MTLQHSRGLRTALFLLGAVVLTAWPGASSTDAQVIVDVSACGRYENAARTKRAELAALGTAADPATGGTLKLGDEIAVLESALQLCSDYFHLHANYMALK